MTSLAPLVEKFFTQRLIEQRSASSNTVASYRDTFRLLLKFAASRLGRDPYELNLGDLDAELIIAFLGHLERARGNSVRTRNARLSAIHSFFRYASFEEPAHAALIQRVMAIPHKRAEHGPIAFLTEDEVEAVLRAPDRSTALGRRDHAVLLLAIQTGLRVSGSRIFDGRTSTSILEPTCGALERDESAESLPSHPRRSRRFELGDVSSIRARRILSSRTDEENRSAAMP